MKIGTCFDMNSRLYKGNNHFSPQLFLRVVCILLPLPAGGGEAVQRHGAVARRVARPCAGRVVEVLGAAHTDGDDGECRMQSRVLIMTAALDW